jgi:parallel beta-helix repeat protein
LEERDLLQGTPLLVTTNADSGAGSLRQAIMTANTLAGLTTIDFAIGSGAQTITLDSWLPSITAPIVLDGTSQPGFNGIPLIVITSGPSVVPVEGTIGLDIRADGCTVKGLVINNWAPLIVLESNNNVVEGNFLGTDATGISNGNTTLGGPDIRIAGNNNTIGGTTSAARNIISGDGEGIVIGSDSRLPRQNNLIEGNYIGTDVSGTMAVGNHQAGIVSNDGLDTTIGGTASGAGNVISGSTGLTSYGVRIDDFGGDVVQGNKIGTNAAGTAAVPNGNPNLGNPGVQVSSAGILLDTENTTIGGTAPSAGNLISGNFGPGITLTSTGFDNTIQGNLIGTDVSGTIALGNSTNGISLAGASRNSLLDNVIAGNGSSGVELFLSVPSGNPVHDNIFQGNKIGTNASGTAALPNQGDGVHVTGGINNTLGGPTPGAGNLISGNHGAGVVVETGGFFSAGNIVQGNQIGTNASGTAALPNQGDGVTMIQGRHNTLGGTTAGAGNLISGNQGAGVVFESTEDDVVQGNVIGTDTTRTTALANQGGGIVVELESLNNTLGGTASGAANVIAGNAQFGILISAGPMGNIVQGNLVGTNASNAANLGNGLYGVAVLNATNNTIGGSVAGAGNVIGNSTEFGLLLSNGANGNLVQGNDIGLGTSGVALPNGLDGVAVVASASNTVGGTGAGAGNVIAGNNRFGVFLNGTGTSGNLVEGNLIGTNAAGTAALPNIFDGIAVANAAANNTLGGTVPAAGNVLSGNGRFGVYLSGAGTTGNLVQANLIGLNQAGTGSLGNTFDGVAVLSGASGNTIGGTASTTTGNIIAGNGRFGILVGAASTVVQDNIIGINLAGSAGLANALDGVAVVGAANNTIGGTATNAGNLISGNGRFGVFLTGPSTSGNVLQGNAIGTNAAGTAALGNTFDGVALVNGANGNTIGGTTAGTGNLISGNARFGVFLSDSGTSGNVVAGNLIGVNRSGTAALGNTFDGLAILNAASGNIVGGTSGGAGNTIASNGRFGILLGVSGTTNNLVQGNFIGTDASGTLVLGNTKDGVIVQTGAASNTVGGTVSGAGNRIANNGGPGVAIGDAPGDPGSVGNAILGNAIYGNGPAGSPIGIDLGSNGPTPNGSGPNGPNHFLNFPIFQSVPTVASNAVTATLTFSAVLANASFRLEFFLNSAADTPQGRTFLGAVSVASNAAGVVFAAGALTPGVTVAVNPGGLISVTLPVAAGTVAGSLTATATLLALPGPPGTVGDTSEFSAPAAFGAG